MKKRFLNVAAILIFGFLVHMYAVEGMKEYGDCRAVLPGYGQAHMAESIAEKTGRERQDAERKFTDYLREYVNYDNYRISLWEEIQDTFEYYFPDLTARSWDFMEADGEDYIVEFHGYNGEEREHRYTARFVLRPNLTIDVLEDTISTAPEKGFCVYTTAAIDDAGADIVYHGCRISEYQAVYYDAGKDVFCNARIPLFSVRGGDEWKEMNRRICGHLRKWMEEEMDYEHGRVSLDYAVKTLDDDIYSVFLYGRYENAAGENEEVKIGMTISMHTGDLLPKSVFFTDEEGVYDYYVDNRDTLYSIVRQEGKCETVEEGEVRFIPYYIEKKEQHVYALNGRWIGNCFYELPHVLRYAESGECYWPNGDVDDVDRIINGYLMNDMGRFFNEIGKKFEAEIMKQDEGTEYGSPEDIETQMGEAVCQCSVESEIFYNNEGKFGVVYHYVISTGRGIEYGDAVAVYDLENGDALEYQDWQSEMLEKIYEGYPEE